MKKKDLRKEELYIVSGSIGYAMGYIMTSYIDNCDTPRIKSSFKLPNNLPVLYTGQHSGDDYKDHAFVLADGEIMLIPLDNLIRYQD